MLLLRNPISTSSVLVAAAGIALVIGSRLVSAQPPQLLPDEDPGPATQAAPQESIVATLLRAPVLSLPGEADSNSPVIWSSVDSVDTLHVLTSFAGTPNLSTGQRLNRLTRPTPVQVQGSIGGVWMEAVIQDPAGLWYGFYHNEIVPAACGETTKMAPRIGAARSPDRGATWVNLGIVLELPAWTVDCDTPNHYFTGGVGDFSVVLDADSTDLYFFYSQYPERIVGQGIAMARLQWADRDEPQGRVQVWRNGVWLPPWQLGTGEEDDPVRWLYPIGSPIYRATDSWHDGTTVDAFWGPSVHWNTYLERWVMLLNRARDVNWSQEGIYVAYATDLKDPRTWSAPARLLEGGRWYPQVIGLEAGSGTDKHAGQVARFFMSGESSHLIRFERP